MVYFIQRLPLTGATLRRFTMEAGKKKICILHTGGTIGMVPTEKGYSPKKDYLEGMLADIPDLRYGEMPLWDVVEFDPLLDSSNIAVDQWNDIGRAIKEKYNDYDGFVVLHGTDTMAYTASALSFMLGGLTKPVIITGSQIPLCEIRSDGTDNLITSMLIASSGKVCEVALYFGGKLLRGNRAIKVSSDRLIAFDSPNYSPLAVAGIEIQYNDNALWKISPTSESGFGVTDISGATGNGMQGSTGSSISSATGNDTQGSAGSSISRATGNDMQGFTLTEFKQTSIGVLKVFPGIQFELFESIMTDRLNGIVLETFGSGNIPSYDDALLPIIRKAFDTGTIITVCSQCMQGTVKLGAYETSSELMGAGAVSGFDMTTEAAVAKLYYLFSLGYDKEKIKELMEVNLRGELSSNFSV